LSLGPKTTAVYNLKWCTDQH